MHYVNALEKFVKENPKKEIEKEKVTLEKAINNFKEKLGELIIEIKKSFFPTK
jgi:hypothetical protein